MKVISIIAPSGIGHYVRQMRVLGELARHIPEAEFLILAQPWQRDQAEGLSGANDIWKTARATLVTDLVPTTFKWKPKSISYQDGELTWSEIPLLNFLYREPHALIISDNLTAPLEIEPKTILMGSFLWSEVLSVHHSSEVQRFIENEKRRLQSKPFMICLREMAMPGVWSHTTPVPVNWMAYSNSYITRMEDLSTPSSSTPTIAILSGTTTLSDSTLIDIARGLLKNTDWKIELSPALRKKFPEGDSRIATITFRTSSLKKYSAVIGRPGIGTITQAIEWKTPIAVISDEENPEMKHNAERVEALNIGVNLGPAPSFELIMERLHDLIYNPDIKAKTTEAIKSQKTDGIKQAVEWIINYLKELNRKTAEEVRNEIFQ